MVNGLKKYGVIWSVILILGLCSPTFSLDARLVFSSVQTVDGVVLRVGHWEALTRKKPAKGIILLLEGMGGFLELYQETALQLTRLGYDVYGFDWRGQGGSSRLSEVPALLHVEDFRDYMNDLHQVIQRLPISKAQPLHLFAVSMGGNVALRYVHEHPKVAQTLTLVAPMVTIKTDPYPLGIAKKIMAGYVLLGQGERFAVGGNTYDMKDCVTHYSPEKYGDLVQYLGRCFVLFKNKELVVGGPSAGWVNAAFESCDALLEQTYDHVTLPVLCVTPLNDHLVIPEAQTQLCRQLPHCTQKIYPEAHHNLMLDKKEIREQFWWDFEDFMRKTSQDQRKIAQLAG